MRLYIYKYVRIHTDLHTKMDIGVYTSSTFVYLMLLYITHTYIHSLQTFKEIVWLSEDSEDRAKFRGDHLRSMSRTCIYRTCQHVTSRATRRARFRLYLSRRGKQFSSARVFQGCLTYSHIGDDPRCTLRTAHSTTTEASATCQAPSPQHAIP